MSEVMDRLTSFITRTQFNDLPEDVIHETKRVLLDSIGCALPGHAVERGKIAIGFAKKLGGSSGTTRSTIIGTKDKVCPANAAFADGELINTLDFDALSRAGLHDTPTVISAPLTQAEAVGASGKDLILATALAFEISGRIKLAAPGGYAASPEQGGKILFPEVGGNSPATLGGAAGAGKLLKLNQGKMGFAIAIAGYICPPNTLEQVGHSVRPVRMTKYTPPGWGAHTAVSSAMLADMGYTGDTSLFDGDFGFWRYTGALKGQWNTEKVVDGLGKSWFVQINYKQYPAGLCIAGALDKFIQIIGENDIRPEEIEHVTLQPHPRVQFHGEAKLVTHDDYSFNPVYLLTCAAHRLAPTDWHEEHVRQDVKIQKYMRWLTPKVSIAPWDEIEKDFALAKLEDPRTYQQRCEVVAKGKTFRGVARHPKGGWWAEDLRNTDEELVKKFVGNASKVLSSDKVNKAAQTIMQLEKLGNTAELLNILAP
ncbi:MAG TPA: MmgE/PrpD family protein [Dehalococcoidia bacterium]|nr:MmgE/PrpD family protein [Dehalococcoidia bacterium]